MQLEVRTGIDIARPREQVFDLAVDMARAPEILTRKGPIPGVLALELQGDGPVRAGSRRLVSLSDKSTITEEVIALDRPDRHAYRWLDRPAFPFSLVVRAAQAEWRFTGATRVDWTYRFELTTPLVYPLAAIILRLFRRWMDNALDRLREIAERA